MTAEEKRAFGQLFQAADRESVGVVTGEVAAKFLERSGLDPRILGKVVFAGSTTRTSSSTDDHDDDPDMGNRRYREPGLLDPRRLWHGAEIDWTCAKWTRARR